MTRESRVKRGLSQQDLAEATRLSIKTIQRIEAGRPVAPGSRRAVLQALDLDPESLETAPSDPSLPPSRWTEVESAAELFSRLMAADAIEVDLDREAWRSARKKRPWFKPELVIVIGDPIKAILEIVDRAGELSTLPAGSLAKNLDELAETMRAAKALGWALASRVDDSGRLSVYLGSAEAVADRVRGGRFRMRR
jgi:transcriptional regulator with XRE-family HTH domain